MNYLYPLLAVLIWSANTVVSKQSAGAIAPTEIGFLRWVLAVLIVTPSCFPPSGAIALPSANTRGRFWCSAFWAW